MEKKKIISAVAVVAVIAAVVIIILAAKSSNNAAEAPSETEPVQTQAVEDNKVYTPTFMYFVSYGDSGFETTEKMIDELKKEYDGRVNFKIINLDDAPEAKENYPVDQQTPALIMLNTHNDISAIEFKCSDKQKLTQYIESALQ